MEILEVTKCSPDEVDLLQLYRKISKEDKLKVLSKLKAELKPKPELRSDFFSKALDSPDYFKVQNSFAEESGMTLKEWLDLDEEQQVKILGIGGV